MRKLIFCFAIICVSVFILSAEEKKDETEKSVKTGEKETPALLGEEAPYGGYGAFFVKGTPVTKKFGALLGFRGMLILKDRYAAGVMFNWLQNQTTDESDPERKGFQFGYMTLVGEYIYPVKNFFSLSGEFGIGFGSIKVARDNSDEKLTIEDKLIVFEPGVNALFSIFSWMQISAGISYRFFGKHDYKPIPLKEINGISGKISIRIGDF